MKNSWKLKTSDLIYFLVCVTLLFEINFFYLVKYPSGLTNWSTVYNKVLPGIFAVVALVSLKLFKCRVTEGRYLRNYLFMMTIFIVIILLVTIVLYPKQRIQTSFRLCLNWLLVYLALPIYYIFQRGYKEKLFRFINLMCFVWYSVIILQYHIFMNSHKIFLESYFADGITTRNGILRINILAFGGLMILFNFDNVFCKKENKLRDKIFSIIQLVLGFYGLFVVQGTRMSIITTVIVISVMYWRSHQDTKGILWKSLLAILAVVWITNTSVLGDFLGSFSITGKYASSSINRFIAIRYFLECFIKSPLFGMAYPGEEYYFQVAHGELGVAYVSDVGFLGMMGQIGIWALIIYVPFVVRMIKALAKLRRNGSKEYIFALGMALYIILGSISQIVLTPQLLIVFPFALAYFEYLINLKENNI